MEYLQNAGHARKYVAEGIVALEAGIATDPDPQQAALVRAAVRHMRAALASGDDADAYYALFVAIGFQLMIRGAIPSALADLVPLLTKLAALDAYGEN